MISHSLTVLKTSTHLWSFLVNDFTYSRHNKGIQQTIKITIKVFSNLYEDSIYLSDYLSIYEDSIYLSICICVLDFIILFIRR